MPSMVDRRIIVRGQRGTVTQWEPLGAQMCDALIKFDDGSECWYASHELKPDPSDLLAGIPLLNRQEVRRENDRRMKVQLETIQARHLKDYKPWPGAEFGKAIVGNAIAGALNEVKERLNARS